MPETDFCYQCLTGDSACTASEPPARLTKAQTHALALIRARGGFACKQSGFSRPWSCARYDEMIHAYQAQEQVLSTRVLNTLVERGMLQNAPGHGYGCCSFWEPVPDV